MLNALFVLLGLLFLVDALRLRKRAAALPPLPSPANAEGSVDERFTLFVADAARVDETTRKQAFAYADAEELESLDLVPGDLSATDRLGLLALVDFATFRNDRLAQGRSAHVALVVSKELMERAQVSAEAAQNPMDFAAAVTRLKRHASRSSAFALAPSLKAPNRSRGERLLQLRAALGGATRIVLGVQIALTSLLLCAPLLRLETGLFALAMFQLQPLIILSGMAGSSPGLGALLLLRAPLELLRALSLFFGPLPPLPLEERAEKERSFYTAELAQGLDRFFEPRRTDCPLCASQDLVNRIDTRDLFQHKPGRFCIDRCVACGHLFQNPRLSIAGLNFYYRDFYDGLGEESLEAVFGYSSEVYIARAEVPRGHIEPKSWLDVGGGHGHFAALARDVWPGVTFDGLDIGESIEEAERRHFIDHGIRGLFPETANSVAEQYDVVSMSHYLEHTRDPRAELSAAHTALREGGLLLIEIPDPTSRLGSLLGRLWVPWFQPQHQHLLSPNNLDKLLIAAGFDTVLVQRGEVHIGVDFFFAVSLTLDRLAPPLHLPWLPPKTFGRVLVRLVVWTLGTPFLLLARLCDLALLRALQRPGWSNAFRVLAKKRA